MKLDFCAVCGTTEDLHQHHIEPVVYSAFGRKKNKKYDPEKKLKDCTSIEIFGWLFDQGVITDDGEITVCAYHHNILHGIMKFQKAEMSKLVKEGQAKARAKGVKFGRPLTVTEELKREIFELKKSGIGIRKIAKQKNVGVSTVYAALKEFNYEHSMKTIKEKECSVCKKMHNKDGKTCSEECLNLSRKIGAEKTKEKLKALREQGFLITGRPTIINEELITEIKTLREKGIGVRKIAGMIGIGVSTVYATLKRI